MLRFSLVRRRLSCKVISLPILQDSPICEIRHFLISCSEPVFSVIFISCFESVFSVISRSASVFVVSRAPGALVPESD